MIILLKKLRHYQLMIQSCEQQKHHLTAQLRQVTQAIDKKQGSLAKFKAYLADYEQQSVTDCSHNVHTYRHKQLFLDKLANVMMMETTGLEQLTGQQNDLMSSYQQLTKKIDGFQQAIVTLNQEQTSLLAHIDEIYYNELALTQAHYRLTKEEN